MKSIRSYLLSRLLGGSAIVLAAAGLSVYLVVTRSFEAQFDRNLEDRIQGFASILFQVEDEVEFEFSQELMPEYAREELADYFELWFQDGRLLERSPSLGGKDLLVAVTPTREPAQWSAGLPDGRIGRYVSRLIEVHHVHPEEGPDRPNAAQVLIVVARGREELVAAERMLLIQSVAVALALLVLIACVSWIAVEKGLEPADRLASTLDAIQVDHLPAGLELGELPSELAPVADKTDALIRRVDTALKRERRTTADIAHELRTPISEILTVSEVALRSEKSFDATRRALATVRDVAARMGRSVSTLLKLARLDMGVESFDRERVDLGEIVKEILLSLSATGRERDLRVENQVGSGVQVEGDGAVLRIVLSNLLSNALYYSPSGGIVTCRFHRGESDWRLTVENDAGELRPEDLRALAEPFWRKDKARTDRDRSGLGLALSRALAEKTGMELGFELEGDTFRAILMRRTGREDLDPFEPVESEVSSSRQHARSTRA